MKNPLSATFASLIASGLALAACGPGQDTSDAGTMADVVPGDSSLRDVPTLGDATDSDASRRDVVSTDVTTIDARDAFAPIDVPSPDVLDASPDDVALNPCAGSTTFEIAVPLALDRTTVQAGQTLTGTVTYRNCTAAPIMIQQIAIAARPPGGTHAGGPYDDLAPTHGAVTVAVGDTVSLTATRDFTNADPSGQWVSYATYQDATGTYHDGPDVAFTVMVATAPSGMYPTGVGLRGINRAGMEYGDDWDGWTGQTYYEIPSATQTQNELAHFKSKGFNTIRLPISWERAQHTLNGPLDAAYSTGVTDYITAATAQGFYVVLDLHNYNRYAQGAFNASGTQVSTYTQRILGDGTLTVAHLSDVWVKLAGLVGTNPRVIFNLMNEPHDFPLTSTQWFAGVQSVINALRATGSTQLILVPNSRGSDVDHWSSYSPNGGPVDAVAALAVTDSANNIAFDMHAYQDNPTSANSYANLVAEVTTWATTNNRRLFLSELGSVATASNGAVGVGGLLGYLDVHSDLWVGWTPWDLSPYSLTTDTHTGDQPPMAWYTPYLTADFLGM